MKRPRYGEPGSYLRARCHQCGHRLRPDLMSTGCPQCGEDFDGRPDPKKWPEQCDCERCEAAREGGE